MHYHLAGKLRKVYLDGDWNIFEGQVFTEFRTDKHVIEPFEIPHHWQRYRSMDWGYRTIMQYILRGWMTLWHRILLMPDTGTQETAWK